MKEIIWNVLAERYATEPLCAIWSPRRKVVLGRELWITVLKAQRDLGLSVPEGAIERYEAVKNDVDLESVATREFKLRHDQLAEIEEFNELAGGQQLIHRGMTSRDKSDNTEQMQVFESIGHVHNHGIAVLARFRAHAQQARDLDIAGRSHLALGQTTTLGKRFTNIAEEFMEAFALLKFLIAHYPLRGIKGAMGTRQDMINLLGNAEKAYELEDRVRESLGFSRVLESTGQVYPRLLDFQIVTALVGLASSMANFALMIRLMAGFNLASEGTAKGQKGSSAMPHKTGKNSRTCERINGLLTIMRGYMTMVSELLGNQFFEGDVSCSVVRRVALPDAFFALDGIMEATLHVLDEMQIYPVMIECELQLNLPFLSSTALLMESVRRGAGRETTHELIGKHALEAAQAVQEGYPNPFLNLLAADPELKLTREEIEACIRPNHGDAPEQVDRVCKRIEELIAPYPEEAKYNPEPLR